MTIESKYGVPTVALHTDKFDRVVQSVATVNGIPGLRQMFVPEPVMGKSARELRAYVDGRDPITGRPVMQEVLGAHAAARRPRPEARRVRPDRATTSRACGSRRPCDGETVPPTELKAAILLTAEIVVRACVPERPMARRKTGEEVRARCGPELHPPPRGRPALRRAAPRAGRSRPRTRLWPRPRARDGSSSAPLGRERPRGCARRLAPGAASRYDTRAPRSPRATTHLGVAIVIEAALGFLGVGVPPPTPTWGNMLADAITALVPQWWLVLFPGAAITVTVLAFNLLGDGIRDTLDPRLSPAVLRLVTGSGGVGARETTSAAQPSEAVAR